MPICKDTSGFTTSLREGVQLEVRTQELFYYCTRRWYLSLNLYTTVQLMYTDMNEVNRVAKHAVLDMIENGRKKY